MEHIRELLTSCNPETLVGSVAIAVFLSVYAIRKFAPKVWFWFESKLFFLDAIESDAIWAFAWKVMQAIPGTLIGALIPALLSGDPKKALLGALAGPVASIGHELIKRYKGDVVVKLPKPPIAPLLALCLALSLSAGCTNLKPAVTSAQVSQDVALAFESAGVALAVADTFTAAYIDSIKEPTEKQVADVSAVVDKLQDVKDALDLARADLKHGREKLRSALYDLEKAKDLLDAAGVKVPAAFANALAALEGVLE